MGTATMKFGEGIIVQGVAGDTAEALIVSGSVVINLESSGEALKIVGTLDHNSSLVFEQPAGSNRASISLDGGDNLDIINNSSFDDINFFTTAGSDTHAAMVITANNRVGIGNFGWAGKSEFGNGEAFPRDELDISGSMHVSQNAVFGGDVVVSGSLYGHYRQITYNKFNRGDNNEFFPRFNSNGSNTSAGENNIFLAPANGKLKYAVLRTRLAAGNTSVALHKANTGTTIANTGFDAEVERIEVSSLAAETSYKFTFTDAASFNFGDVLGISINPSNDPDNGNITCVWEFDFTD